MGEGKKALFAVCERVPGATAAGVRLGQLMVSLGAHLEMDGLSLKGADMAHILRLGTGRMMRVPAPEGPLLERVRAYQRALNRQLGGDAYDLVHAYDLWTAAVAVQHQSRSDFKLVAELDELPSETLAERSRGVPVDDKARAAVRRAEQQVLERAQALVVSTPAAARLLVQAGAPEQRVHVIPPGLDDALSVPPPAPDGTLTVLYAGAPDPARGLATFLEALKSLPPQVRGVLCRTGREPAAEEAVAKLGLHSRVAWADAATASQLAAAYQSAGAVVLLPLAPQKSLHAARVPRRLLEAMQAGRPVVVGEVRGVTDLLDECDCAVVVPSRNPRALAAALGALAANSSLREGLASRGRAAAAASGWRPRLAAYVALYDGLLGTNLGERLLGRTADAVLAKARANRKAPASSVVVGEERRRAPAPLPLPAPVALPEALAPRPPSAPAPVVLGAEPLPAAAPAPVDLPQPPPDDADPWGGDTVAIDGPPPQMLEDALAGAPPPPPASEPKQLLPAPARPSAQAVAPGAGRLRSVALLSMVDDDVPAPEPPQPAGPRPSPSSSRARTQPRPSPGDAPGARPKAPGR